MPPRSSPRARTNPPNIDPNVFAALSVADLRSLRLQHGILSTGVRTTLERRLRGLNTAVSTNGETTNNNTPHNGALTAQVFTAEQLKHIQDLIKDTVQQSAGEIASEAAKAAVNAMKASSHGDRTPGKTTPPVPGTGTAVFTK